jgi:FkbH-like protein
MNTPHGNSIGADALAGLTAPIKLVIWDLDDTYWFGTLSEGPIREIPANQNLVRQLNRRGIVNAICSKNDHVQAELQLESEGMWSEFVFPSINWLAKGPRIATLIRKMGLRSSNVLFVDDNVLNRREAEHYAPGIQAIEPEGLLDLLAKEQLAGRADPALSRLAQYRILQTKVADSEAMNGSNEDFLRSSSIRVAIHDDAVSHRDRLLELVNRSNQLNYTKTRFEETAFDALLSNPDIASGYVTVRDKYGDHGVCGFFAHDELAMVNFSFSCRILNMGVERWVYRQLGSLPIAVEGDVATDLHDLAPIDWVTIDDGGAMIHEPTPADSIGSKGRVLIKGGCDLSVITAHLGGLVETEFSFPSSSGALVHQEHTEILRRATTQTLEAYGSVIDQIPFLDRAAYSSKIRTEPSSFGTIVYSMLMDYTQGLYRYRDSNFVVPFGEFPVDATLPANHARYTERLSGVGLDQNFFTWFSDNFTFEGPLSPAQIGENVRWLRGQTPASVQLVLMNAAEVVSPNDAEHTRHEHHAACNLALQQAVEGSPNTVILDVRTVVTSRSDLTDNIRHYSRRVYLELAKQVASAVSVKGIKRRHRLTIFWDRILLKARRFAWRLVQHARFMRSRRVGRGGSARD